MTLNWLQRLALAVLGLGAMGAGVVASIMEWASAGVVSLISSGFILTIFSIVGVFANVHLKDGNLEWPKPEEPKTDSQAREEIAQLRDELKAVVTRLDNYILARDLLSPAGASAAQLSEMLDAYQELDQEIKHREFTGEDHDDGTSLAELCRTRDELHARVRSVERWRQAQLAFSKNAAAQQN